MDEVSGWKETTAVVEDGVVVMTLIGRGDSGCELYGDGPGAAKVTLEEDLVDLVDLVDVGGVFSMFSMFSLFSLL